MKKAKAREKNMDGLSYFRHVAIVALDFPTNPKAPAGRGVRNRDGDGIGIARVGNSGAVSRCIGFIFVAGVKSGIRMARRRVPRDVLQLEKVLGLARGRMYD